jgi:NAD(P)H dehydrogenase (quinone)
VAHLRGRGDAAGMNVFQVVAHPEPRSFNLALAGVARTTLQAQGHEVRESDLYRMGFDPVSDRHNFTTVKDPVYFKQQMEELHATEQDGFAPEVEREIASLEWCDLLILQFPLWWFGLPAILKGWADRVLAFGRTYGQGRIYDTGVFGGKRAFLSLTTGGPREAYVPSGFNGDLDVILRPIHRGILYFCGFTVLPPHVVYGPARLSDDERKQALATYRDHLGRLDDLEPLSLPGY